MIYRRFYIPFLLVLPIFIIISCSLSIAQNTTYYNPNLNYQTGTLGYPNYQNTIYSGYQTSSYWPYTTSSYLDPYSQTNPYNSVSLGNYVPSFANPYGSVYPYGYSPLNTGNLFYNYDPLGYSYSSLVYNPLSSLGLPLNLAGLYNTQISAINTTTNGTTNSDGSNYTAQATSYYPSIFSGLTTSPLSLSGLYLNPLVSYLPNQNYYQNPYVSYPYNYNTGLVNTINPYQSAYTYNPNPYINPYATLSNPYASNTVNPYNQTINYNQPLPYYQTNSSTTSTTEANLLNVNGSWAGTWFTTLSDGTIEDGDLTLSLTQNGTALYGNISFAVNSYQKINTTLNGTINGTSITLTGILVNGVEFYTLSVKANISGTNLSGTYSINTNSGYVIESGTYTVAHL
ncbi:MAG: hypothetical protein ACMUIU_03835 [bacterium]